MDNDKDIDGAILDVLYFEGLEGSSDRDVFNDPMEPWGESDPAAMIRQYLRQSVVDYRDGYRDLTVDDDPDHLREAFLMGVNLLGILKDECMYEHLAEIEAIASDARAVLESRGVKVFPVPEDGLAQNVADTFVGTVSALKEYSASCCRLDAGYGGRRDIRTVEYSAPAAGIAYEDRKTPLCRPMRESNIGTYLQLEEHGNIEALADCVADMGLWRMISLTHQLEMQYHAGDIDALGIDGLVACRKLTDSLIDAGVRNQIWCDKVHELSVISAYISERLDYLLEDCDTDVI